ncbi:hypothetical protein ACH35V_16195 [Actinomadura sp. 1N219]|uniref:hypothetical protein n=1 Tax=Actinomadura sp. 1N219 TaxID=3375152 RepID=UPI0037BE037A
MSDHHQPGNLDRRAAERLLDGAYDHARLHALLAAAAAPGRPEELAGEDAAVAAFRAAPRPEPRSRTAALRRFLTIKALAVAGGALILTGGAAYATITGQLPGRDPAPSSPSPSHREGKDTNGDENPATRSSSPAPPSTGSPHGKSKQHGKSGAPGQQKKTKEPKPRPPRHTPEPPRGPGVDNGNTPTEGGAAPGNTTTSGGTPGENPPPTTAPRRGTGSGVGSTTGTGTGSRY